MKVPTIRRNDVVVVLAGKDKGKQGRVLKVMADSGRAIVENVAKIKRHTRPNPGKGIKGGVVEREGSLHCSNIMLVCPECSKPTRVARQRDNEGTRTRTCKHCKAVVDRAAKD